MPEVDLCYLSIAEASSLMERKELKPTALLEAVFRRIEETDSALHSYVRLMHVSALEEARRAEARALSGSVLGPLDGIPQLIVSESPKRTRHASDDCAKPAQ